jgi:putative endonuclease
VRSFYVYILASRSKALYIGVSSDVQRRVYEHKMKLLPGFTTKYNIDRLVYLENAETAQIAIAREKQLKGWTRARKIELIEAANPEWDDLSEGWYAADVDPSLRSG